MARVLWREAPLQGYEEWWGKFEGYLLENHQSRAWPIVGQIVKACQAVSGPKSIRNFNDTSVFEFKYQRVLDYFLKHKAPAPYYNEPEITSRLIKEGYLSDEREARFFGFALDEEVIPPFLMGSSRRFHAAVFSFIAGVMPPMPMLGRSLL
jgi:hypothetical protein